MIHLCSSKGQTFYTDLWHHISFLAEICKETQFGILVLLVLRTQIVTTILLRHVKLAPVYAKVVFKKNSQAAISMLKVTKVSNFTADLSICEFGHNTIYIVPKFRICQIGIC
jgi:hypothetical protein